MQRTATLESQAATAPQLVAEAVLVGAVEVEEVEMGAVVVVEAAVEVVLATVVDATVVVGTEDPPEDSALLIVAAKLPLAGSPKDMSMNVHTNSPLKRGLTPCLRSIPKHDTTEGRVQIASSKSIRNEGSSVDVTIGSSGVRSRSTEVDLHVRVGRDGLGPGVPVAEVPFTRSVLADLAVVAVVIQSGQYARMSNTARRYVLVELNVDSIETDRVDDGSDIGIGVWALGSSGDIVCFVSGSHQRSELRHEIGPVRG